MSPIQELPYYLPLKKKKKKKKNNNNNPWNNTRLLFSSLGFISRIIFESSVVERYLLCVSTSLFLPLSFSLSGRWFRRKFLEHRKKNSAARALRAWATRDRLSKTKLRLHPKQGREERGETSFSCSNWHGEYNNARRYAYLSSGRE